MIKKKLIEPQTSTGLSLNDVSNQRIYTIDVRLFTYSTANFQPTPKEFTGINTLSIEYFKDNVGFGITNIDISINTSLQPVIEITFKDLYGNTVFSRDSSSSNPNFSDIFDWPPPKFDLVYKGYLGKPTRLMLNLKKTDIQYSSTDGSFIIKCSFVPNAWGPFADVPALFLYAVKKLKIDENLGNGDATKVITFFDLIKIGKKIDSVRKSFNEQYSDIKDKLNQTRSSLNIAFTTGGMNPGYQINGVIQSKNRSIEGFNNVVVYDFTKDADTRINSLKSLKSSGIDSGLLSDYFLSKTQVGNSPNFNESLDKFLIYRAPIPLTASTTNDIGDKNSKLITILNQKRALLDKNLQVIDEVITAESFAQNETQIAATTISEIFKSLAGDTGYLLGRILRAGFGGYENNKKIRDEKQKELIGRFYPLMIQNKDVDENIGANNVQTIASQEFFKNESVVSESLKNENEVRFVDDFINAIAFGLGDTAGLEEPIDSRGRRQLVRRLSNLEAMQANPYFPTYNSIIENMVVRSGIYAFFTNSADANTPGDYYRATNVNREEPEEAAKGEMNNLTDALVKEIPIEDVSRLRNALNYFKRAFDEDTGIFTTGATGTSFGVNTESILNVGNGVGMNFNGVVSGIDFKRVGIPEDFSSSDIIYNNNLAWFNLTKKYNYVLFTSREEVEYLRQLNSAPTDSEFKGSEVQDNTGTFFGDEEPPGIVIIDAYAKDDKAGAGRIKYLNTFLKDGQVISYDSLKSEYDAYLRNKPFNINNCIADESKYRITEDYGGFPVAYAIYTAEDYAVGNRAWDLFGNDLQKRFLHTLASELLIKLDKIQDEKKLQIGTVQAKANEQKFSIYNQMHHIFYQWSSLIFDYSTENPSSPDYTQRLYKYINLPQSLEEIYKITSTENDNVVGGFQYLAPLIRYNNEDTPIDVEDSIINLESCYNIDANTTVLNVIQNICNKNNFLFFPLAGGNIFDVEEMFTPQAVMSIPRPGNKFMVLWAPTPESRAKDNNGNDLGFIQDKNTINQPGFIVKFGSTDNALFKNVRAGTDSTKTTAESIVNLQRLVDKQVDNKQVTKDCSTIPVLEGRSYTCEIDTLGNAQISPMQFFFVDNMPIFGGLYQIMEVHHTITPNNFETKFKGMKMRYNQGKLGGIPPVTLNTSRDLAQKYNITGGTENSYADATPNGYNDPKTIYNNPPAETTDQFNSKSVSALRQKYDNGQLPSDALIESKAMRVYYIGADKRNIKYKLYKDAAESLDSLMNYFAKVQFQGKQVLSITDGYRDIDEQRALKARLGDQAATPGRSNHGWGVAVDFWWGLPTSLRKQEKYRQVGFTHPMYKWFFENAWRYGWYNPAALRDNANLDEWWHWEFIGNQGAPRIIPSLYASNFDFNNYPKLIKEGGGFFKA